MKDVARLIGQYVRQRERLGEGRVVMPEPAARTGTEPEAEPAELASGDVENRATPRERAAPPEAPGCTGETGWRRGAPPIPPPGMVVAPPTKDLFTGDPLADMSLTELGEVVLGCAKCRLCEKRQRAVPGEGPDDARLVVVGEGPGAKEDETGRPFVGRAGELLTEILAAIDLPREHVFICNIVKCRPPENRKPLQDEIDACVPYLYRQLELIRPAVILAMGGTAAETLLQTKQSLGALRGKVHEFRGVPLVVTYHPAALLRNPNWKKPTWDDVRIARRLVDRRS